MKRSLLISTFFLTLSCSKKDPDPQITYSILNPYLSTNIRHQYEMQIGDAKGNRIPNSQFTWTSNNEKVASIKDGIVTARKVGLTEITGTPISGRPLILTFAVDAIYKTFDEPLLKFGSTKAEVKSFEKRTLLKETETALTYKGENAKVEQVNYVFESGKMIAAGPLLAAKTGMTLEAETFLSERYPDNGVVSGRKIYLDDGRKYGSYLLGTEDEGLQVVYAEYK